MDVTDLPNQTPVLLTEAPKVVALFTGKEPHIATVWRWVGHGCRGHQLETAVVAGRRVTTRGAIERFIAATNATASARAALAQGGSV